ncbi:MAG: ABC transporter permease [Clostridia bacterium]|nr:ABC transporter permease [Clostridia bacterium]
MQNIKIMFRSPRFLVGFILFMAVVCYAVFFPLVNTADPKADRRTNPFYEETLALRAAIEAEDSDAVYAELDKLDALDKDEDHQAVLDEVRAAMDAGGLTNAAKGAKQIKKTKTPVAYAEYANLRDYLGATDGTEADVEKAREEMAALTAHNETVAGIIATIESGDYETALADIEEAELADEFAEIVELIEAEASADEIAELTASLTNDHTVSAEWLVKIAERLEEGGFDGAADALKGIQKTTLIPNDQAPDSEFLLGTDNFSRDILLEMAYGARLSLEVGLMAGCIATLIGITIGLLAGFCGGIVDNILSTVTNIFIVIPSIVVLILISVALGQMKDAWVTGLIIGLTTWPWTARAVRAQTTSLRNRDHVNMARITGYGTLRIICTEILPYVASYVVMAFILQVAGGITSEATLAILGLGDPTAISLGRMINWAMQYEAVRSGRWWEFVPVALCIAMITYGLYLMNSGMDQVFNPKIRS